MHGSIGLRAHCRATGMCGSTRSLQVCRVLWSRQPDAWDVQWEEEEQLKRQLRQQRAAEQQSVEESAWRQQVDHMHQQLLDQQKHTAALRSRLQQDAQRAKQEHLRRIEPIAKARARSRGLATLGLDPEIMSLSEKFGKMSQLVDEVQQQMEAQYGLTHLDGMYMPGDAATGMLSGTQANGTLHQHQQQQQQQQQQQSQNQVQQRQQLKLQELLQDAQQPAPASPAPTQPAVASKQKSLLQPMYRQQQQQQPQRLMSPAHLGQASTAPQQWAPAAPEWQTQQQQMQHRKAQYAPTQQPLINPPAAAATPQQVMTQLHKQQRQQGLQLSDSRLQGTSAEYRTATHLAAQPVQQHTRPSLSEQQLQQQPWQQWQSELSSSPLAQSHSQPQQQHLQQSAGSSAQVTSQQARHQAPAWQPEQRQWQQPWPQQLTNDADVQQG